MPGVRFKAHEQDGRKLQLAVFTQEFKELDWRRQGHIGYVLEGEGELQLGGQTIRVKPGDGLFIPPGEEHKHMLRVLSERVRIVLAWCRRGEGVQAAFLKRENSCISAAPV